MRGSGGTEGGVGKFLVGLGLSILALYLFFDSVRVSTAHAGFFSTWAVQSAGGSGLVSTASMGLLFVPFFLGVLALFCDARQRWAWVLMWCGVGVLAIEILSRLEFFLSMKLTQLLTILVLFAAGCALMIRSYRDESPPGAAPDAADFDTDPEATERPPPLA